MPAEEILTVKEAAKELRTTTDTVLDYIRKGELVAAKIGKGYKITRNELNEFIRKKSTGPRE